jgi:Flp pilus assembly protein TadD
MPSPSRTRALLAALIVAAVVPVARAQSGRVGGIVRDETGEPIKGATVRAENPVGLPRTFTASTDDKGRFTIIGLRSGQWTFTAEAPGFDPKAGSLRLGVQSLPNRPLLFTLTRSFGGPIPVLGSVSPRDLQARLAEADQLFSTKRWDEALSAYQGILEDVPALSVINLQLGAIYRAQGNFDGAIAAYRALLAADPDNAKALVGLATINLENGDAKGADAALRQAASQPSADREVLCAMGDVEVAEGNPSEASTWYQRAADADPYWGRPIYLLAKVALSRGDRAQGEQLLRKVLEIDPLSPEATEAEASLGQLTP